MANYYICLILQRIVLPLVIIACSLMRPVGISLVYLFTFFLTPFVPVASSKNLRGPVGAYFIILITISTILLVGHIGLQIAAAIITPEEIFTNCSFTEILLRHIGFINLYNLKPLAIIEWVVPEILMFFVSIIVYVIIKKLNTNQNQNENQNGNQSQNQTENQNQNQNDNPEQSSNTGLSTNVHQAEEGIPTPPKRTDEQLSQATVDTLGKLGPFFSLSMLFLTSAFRPSVPGGFYFLIFICCTTYWSCYKSLKRGFAILLRFIMFVLIIHSIAILSYQTPWPQEQLSNSTIARLSGLEPLFMSTCDKGEDIRIIDFNSKLDFDSYLNPISILICYYVLALTSKILIGKKEKRKRVLGPLGNGTKMSRQVSVAKRSIKSGKSEKWTAATQKLTVRTRRESFSTPNERTPLVRRSTRRTPEAKRLSDSKAVGNIPLETLNEQDEAYISSPSLMDQLSFGFHSIGGFIYLNSYIFTNVVMMAWSIIYHSWLAFVFLIWANILWMIPNQRKTMLRSSPFILLYAILLLIAQYVYSMNLTDDELPSKVKTTGINLKQIGFYKPDRLPCGTLIVKTLFTVMFWVTVRQLFKEKQEKKKSSTIADMVAPLQVTVGAATSTDLNAGANGKNSSKFLEKAGKLLKEVLVKLWVWLLIFVIFLSGITGNKMTGFRICYMALFLFFLLAFQLSWKAWSKIMYGFWLVLIIYAMTTLILIYTYQFDRFDQYWKMYLNISKTLQTDIGLEKYKTRDLFLHLVNPTLIVVMTVIQVHYFHKKFLESLQTTIASELLPFRIAATTASGTEPPKEEKKVVEDVPKKEKTDTDDEENSEKMSKLSSFRRKSKRKFVYLMQKIQSSSKGFVEVNWLFVEIHFMKLVYLVAFILCINEVCFLHIIFIFLATIAIISRTNVQIVLSRLISVIVSAFLLTKMIYQVDYIKHSNYSVNCTNNDNLDNATDTSADAMPMDEQNNANWFGLQKITSSNSLASLLKDYIFYMVVITIHAVAVFRQAHMRAAKCIPNVRPHVLFAGITRKDAEKDLPAFIKYMLNYGYFKFGIEITLISLVALISYRQDLVAILYAIWLCILFHLSRTTCARIWPFFQGFTGVIIIIQYLLFVGIPPGLCVEYPWERSEFVMGLKYWAMLPDSHLHNQASKLIWDFILYMFINRQSRVFSLEKRNEASTEEFPGGTNKSIIHEIDNLGVISFENPTPDFIANVRNWLDIMKVAVLTGFFWFTLAVVFLSGTNTVSWFSIGYLVGSFIFLWQGTDFYLRPIAKILKWWNTLLAYNVAVIALKTVLQIAGCLFLSTLEKHACWIVHLLGISCISMPNILKNNSTCPASKDVTGLMWDAICFMFLIFQLRIFHSHYFCHIINDTKASTILASRGAELIEELRQKQMLFKVKQEREVLRKIKKKMEKIRATQQKLLRPIEKPTHFDEIAEERERSNSFSSCKGSGYHTPIDYENELNDEVVSDLPTDTVVLLPPPSRKSSTVQTQAPSPSSAIMTVSLDAYLEPRKLSIGSPPNSDLLARMHSSDESFPVFSPPPYDQHDESTHFSSLLPPTTDSNLLTSTDISRGGRYLRHRRQSSINTVSWNERLELSDNRSPLSPSDVQEKGAFLDPKFSYKRQSSVGAVSLPRDDSSTSRTPRRRYSNLSWAAHDDSMSTKSRRPYSWGPVGETYYMESLITEISFTSHAESIRAGDYYMFDDLDEKIELDLIDEESDFLEAEGEIGPSEMKMNKRKTLLEVYKDIEKTRRKEMKSEYEELLRRKSFSAPVTKYGVSSMSTTDESMPQRSTLSDSLPIPKPSDFHEKDDKGEKAAKTLQKPMPSTSKKSPDGVQTDKDGGESDKGDKEEEEVGLIPRLVEGFMVSLAIRLNRFSRNYRYVMKILAKEKKILKESKGFGIGARTGAGAIWTPFKFIKKPASSDGEPENTLTSQTDTNIENKIDTPYQSDSNDDVDSDFIVKRYKHERDDGPNNTTDRGELIQMGEIYLKERKASIVPEIRIMAPSLERGLDDTATSLQPTSHTKNTLSQDDIYNYEEDFTTRDHHIAIEVLIALWYAVLSNTDIVCYFVVFINQIVSASVLSLPLPIMVFIWGTLALPRPTKTFWVTLIAYTQSIVLIKCVSQFLMIYFDRIVPAKSMSATKIIGIEYQENYSAYDLLLLLMLFFHRFVLKSQGLWKSDYEEDSLQVGPYTLKEDQTPDENLGESAQEINDAAIITKGEDTLMLVKRDSDEAEDSDAPPVHVSNFIESPGNYLPGIVKITSAKYCSSVLTFFKDLIYKSRLPSDVYAMLFFCDFINFFVLLFGFTAFGPQLEDVAVTTYLEENKVPIPFLIMLLLQFVLILIDRALYLRKALVYKVIFHFALVIGLHIWMFFVIPAVTERSFNSNMAPVIFYIFKCFYLLLSSYQIRCGYPSRILGNFLTKGFSLFNMIAFRVYMLVPFLYEFRTLMDWVCTDTTMTLFDWLKMEDIFSTIFLIKCTRQMEQDLPAPRAQKKGATVKVAIGGTAILVLFAMIWGPMTLFALGNTVGTANIPTDVTVSLKIGPYEPVYQMSAQSNNILTFDPDLFNSMQNAYDKDKVALTFLANYDEADIAAVVLGANSTSLWNISPPEKERFLDDLIKGQTLNCRFRYAMTRRTETKSEDKSDTTSAEVTFEMDGKHPGRQYLISMLKNNSNELPLRLPGMLPKFVKVKRSGQLSPIPQLISKGELYQDILIKPLFGGPTNEEIWWEVKENCSDPLYDIFKKIPFTTNCSSNIILYTFNDKLFPSTVSFITSGGIIYVYVTYVFIFSKMLKDFVSGSIYKIMFDDLPYVDRILQLCLDIYLVREALEFTLEEDLFAKLIFVYRSPETMIKWTRPKEENTDDETEETESIRSRASVRRRAE